MDELDSIIKQINEEFGEGTITTANQIPRPQSSLDREAFDDFNTRNPMAGGGMLVQPSADGSRPGYNGKRGPSSKPITFFPKNVQKLIKDYGVKKYYKLDRSGKSMVRQGVNVGVGSGVGSSGPPKSKEMIKFLNYATKNKDTIKDKTITEIIQASGANVGKSNARKRLKENKIKIGTADQSTVLKEVKLKTEKPIFNGINNFAKNWINKNQKKYGVTEYDKFISDFANAWQKELNKPLYKNYGGDRILSNPDGTPKTNTLFGKQETGFTINGLKPPNERTSGLFYKRVFYKNKLKNKDFKKKVNNYLDWVLQDKRGKGNLGLEGGGKSNYLKAAQKVGLDIDKDVLYFFGEVMQGDLLTAGEGFYSIVDKEIGGNKASKYKNKLNISYQNWINNIEEVSKLAGVDSKVIINNQLKEAKKMTELFDLKKLPFEFRYAQDHLFGLAEAKALGDPKIAKQTLKNLVALTKQQNYILGTKGFSAKRTALIKKFKNASLENKANIVNQLNTLAEEYVPGRLQYNVKKDGSLKITNLRPETTFRERAISYRNLAKNFPVAVKKQFALLGGGKCKTTGFLNQGGRVGLQDGTPSIDFCFKNALERIRKGGVDFTKAEAMNFDKLTKGLRAVGASNIMKFGILPEVLFEGALIADKMASEGDSFMQGLRTSYVSIPFQAMGMMKTYEEGRKDEILAAAPESQRGKVLDVMSMQDTLKKRNELAAQSQNLKNQIEDTDRISDGDFGYVGDSQDLQKRLSETRADLQDLYRGDAGRAERMLTSSPLDLNIKDELTMNAYKSAVEKADADRASNILFAPGAGLGIDTQIKKRMDELPITPEYAKEQLQATGDYYGKGYTPYGLNKLFTLFGRQNPKFGFDEEGKYSEEKGLNDYMNYLRTLNFAENFRDEKAGGGIAKMAGVDQGPPPESGPNSQGLQGLLNRVKKG